jgi:hypothetical protein
MENDPGLRARPERLVETKVKPALDAEREARFREMFALILVRPADPPAGDGRPRARCSAKQQNPRCGSQPTAQHLKPSQ